MSSADKSSCSSTCTSSDGVLCAGCGKHFCERHSSKHRDQQANQMQKVHLHRDQLQRLLREDASQLASHPLMKKIDEWEQRAIAQVQRVAVEVREQLTEAFAQHIVEINESFERLGQQVNGADHQSECMEREISAWLEQFTELNRDYRTPKTINIRQDEHPHAFINRINLHHLSIDSLHEPVGDIHWNDLTRTITHGPSVGDAIIRGRTAFVAGRRQFRFHIRKLGVPKWAFFGVLSSSTPSQASLAKTPTLYGWAGHQQVWLNGHHHHQYDDFRSEIDNNHTVSLSIDCGQCKMRFVNESLSMAHEIDVCKIKCPLPWVLCIGLYGAGDQICLQLA